MMKKRREARVQNWCVFVGIVINEDRAKDALEL
jgi:hypothetical protein